MSRTRPHGRLHALALALLLLASPALASPVAPAAAAPAPTVDEPAPLPPLGWNSWNTFYCNINEQMIRQTADAMVSTGLAAAGYQYVVVDDCWMQDTRGPDGNLRPHTSRFPSGMKALGDYIHSKGLKFGLYHAPREKTCDQYFNNRPGTSSNGNETRDAQLFASWGVDYVKHDWCDPRGSIQEQVDLFKRFGDALKATGRPIVYSINPNSAHDNTAPRYSGWGAFADMWRTSEDLKDAWSTGCPPSDQWCFVGITEALDVIEPMREWTRPGQYNDPDMLMVGVRGTLSPTENRAHMSMWAMLSAPLIMGNDVRNMSADVRSVLTNRDVLAIDQDPLVRQADRVRDDGDAEVWAKPLADGSAAVALLNRGNSARSISATLAEAGLPGGTASYREVWSGATGQTSDRITTTVPAHGVALYRVTPGSNPGPTPTTSPTPTPTTPPGSSFALVSAASGRCLDAPNSATTNGTRPVIWDCHGRDNQRWAADGATLRVLGRCLDAPNGASAGTAVQLYDCHGGTNQQWTTQSNGTIRGVASGLCLDVDRNLTANGTGVLLWHCTGSANQVWSRR
ncbi:Ricin B lectin [Cellulomonas flavigena DSM 20109]|uniref:Alpha-galactosidase n=1 Tax=Cellulomonas flavigena (strain ATCC 482 / DSM 20109 / BCRC 11376 / JCM 18109 / NBRC 3775 / NCIMB 8073 / NRS 134) TaxID=446466 RepID=D5UHU7_CELFN|nr:ricin-type beta-trefoil lectin domain protein [Cellulomonas flavigena]ADG73371.1 Ricin B lectin [Cellulomonas flavigena DSM 20109]